MQICSYDYCAPKLGSFKHTKKVAGARAQSVARFKKIIMKVAVSGFGVRKEERHGKDRVRFNKSYEYR